MKIHRPLLLATALFGATLSTQAQNPTPAPGDKPGGKWRDKFSGVMPEEMKEKFQAARDELLQDPEMKALKEKADQAGKEFRDAMREAMINRDPELAEQVGAFFESRKKQFEDRKKNDGDRPKKHKDKGEASKPPIPPEQRDRMEKAREIAKQAPAVQSAEAKLKAAQSPEERAAAGKEFREAMRNAMLTADPSLADVLEQKAPPAPPEPKPAE
jgi:hypothetical protein